jgi:hypothetical protein
MSGSPDLDAMEDAIADAAYKDPSIISSISVKSDKVYLAALSIDIFTYRFIHDPSPQVIEYVYERDRKILTDPSETETWMSHVKLDPRYLWFAPVSNHVYVASAIHDNALKYINNPSYDVCKLIVSINPNNIVYVDKLTDEIIDIAMISSAGSIINKLPIKYQTHARCSQAVVLNPCNLSKIEESQMNFEQLSNLIKSNPSYIELIDNPSEKIQLVAINANPKIYKVLTNPTPRVTFEAYIRKSTLSLRYANLQTRELCELCVSRNPSDISYVHDDMWYERLTLIAIQHLHIDSIPDKFITETCINEYIKLRPMDLLNTKYSLSVIEKYPELIVHERYATCDMWKIAVQSKPYLLPLVPIKFKQLVNRISK